MRLTPLTGAVFPPEALASFLAMPLDSQLYGIAALAHIGGDTVMRDAMMAVVRQRQQAQERLDPTTPGTEVVIAIPPCALTLFEHRTLPVLR